MEKVRAPNSDEMVMICSDTTWKYVSPTHVKWVDLERNLMYEDNHHHHYHLTYPNGNSIQSTQEIPFEYEYIEDDDDEDILKEIVIKVMKRNSGPMRANDIRVSIIPLKLRHRPTLKRITAIMRSNPSQFGRIGRGLYCFLCC